ncbi:hypothetical protein PV02_01635 [Methanolobus chelungpuianus]|uniref:Uncharacterized protein n=1 Tax=Methanolobus chelungpuianus TaxID=502115 RepID=A0AAE3KYA2_9EURY|nr:hypothetical protein [Methanolobus chelungpuianus]
MKKGIVIGFFLIIAWTTIVLIAASAIGIVTYEEVRYFFWLMPISLPIFILLFSHSSPPEMGRHGENRTRLALITTFVCLAVAFIAGILKGKP